MRMWIGSVAVFGFIFALLGILGFGMVKTSNSQRDSGLAPDFTISGYDGSTITLSKLRGQVVVINFWASWCLTCRQEAEYLETTWRHYQDQGVVFIGVDYVDTESEALKYIKQYNITYINGPDLQMEISDAYNIKGVPETYFVDRGGILRGVYIGPLEPPYLDDKIEELLSQPYQAMTP